MFGKKKSVPKKGAPVKKAPQNSQRNGAPQAVRGSVGRSVPSGSANQPSGAARVNAQRKPSPNGAKPASRKGLFKKRGKSPAPAPTSGTRASMPNNAAKPASQSGLPSNRTGAPAQKTAPKPALRKGLFKKHGKSPAPAQGRPAPNNAQKPLKPVPEQARRAADMATLAKTRTEQPKRPYRGGNYTLYFILAAIVVGVVMAILSNTVLFKCSSIEVTGTTRYSAEEIIASAGVKTGDNLLHVNAEKAAENVMSAFAFIDKAEVKKNYPTKLVIDITEAVNWFALVEGGKTNVISRGGKILGSIPADGLVVVKGFEAKSLEVGTHLASAVEAKNKIAAEIFTAADKVGLQQMTEIDMTDRFSIKITVENRIILDIGPITQLESKLRVAQAVIEKKIGEEERVTLILTNPERVAVETLQPQQKPVSSSSDKQASESAPESSDSAPEDTSDLPENSDLTSAE